MRLPFFYIDEYDGRPVVLLKEETSRHVVQVLRMHTGGKLNLTDGKGNLLTGEITDAHKKHCAVKILENRVTAPPGKKIILAISLLKNTNRFEWFLEKATEIGVTEIVPLICERTEKEKFRYDRLQQICISAMLQSQQCRLPLLHEPVPLEEWVKGPFDNFEKFIAHCEKGEKKNLLTQGEVSRLPNRLIAIGPEGDFTAGEIAKALEKGFIAVSLGDTRLRTETAGVVAATLLCHI